LRAFDWRPIGTGAIARTTPIQKEFGLGKIASRILLARGLKSSEQIRKYLQGSYSDLYDPFLFADMSKAVDRFLQAQVNDEKVFIHGDYDCDGITSAALIKILSENLGMTRVTAFVPDRSLGYGLSKETLTRAIAEGHTLIVTCDCGTAERESHAIAKNNGVDIIVLDHHSFEKRPDVYAFINPNEGYPFKSLCGAGVAFKFIQAIDAFYKVYPQDYTDLVAIATIADSEPITDENRILVRDGLKRLENTSNLGLFHLVRASGLLGRKLTSDVIGFIVAPKINAAGRIANPNISLELLLTKSNDRAEELAKELVKINKQRMDINNKIRDEAVEQVETKYKNDRFLVLHSDSWHGGVIGIVASTMVEIYNKPCIIISDEYGSARTIPEFSLLQPLKACEDLLVRWGGHPMAAGMKIRTENVDKLRVRINEIVAKTLPVQPKPYMTYDFKLKLKDVNEELVKDLEKLEPFGMGNITPHFVVEDVHIARSRITKDGQHLQLSVRHNKNLTSAVGFWMSGHNDMVKDHAQKFDILFFVERSKLGTAQIIVRDMKEVSINW